MVVSRYCSVLQWTAKKCTKIYNARAQPLFSLNLLFSDVPVAVEVDSWHIKTEKDLRSLLAIGHAKLGLVAPAGFLAPEGQKPEEAP